MSRHSLVSAHLDVCRLRFRDSALRVEVPARCARDKVLLTYVDEHGEPGVLPSAQTPGDAGGL